MKYKFIYLLIICILIVHPILAERDTCGIPDNRRFITVLSIEGAAYTGTMVCLNQLWYADYPHSSFHWINDNKEWLQMDKAGHLVTSYHFSRIGYKSFIYSGIDRKRSLLFGGTLGWMFLASIEVFDAFSSEWGASWGDLIANTLGSGMFVGQEFLFKKQVFGLKYSFHKSEWADQRPEVLGSNIMENTLKDYNGQTYWLTCNISSVLSETTVVPKWINIAVGYGADNMIGGYHNDFPVSKAVPARIRQYYLSLDLALSEIPVRNKFLREVLYLIDFVKIPFPALEINSSGKMSLKPLYF